MDGSTWTSATTDAPGGKDTNDGLVSPSTAKASAASNTPAAVESKLDDELSDDAEAESGKSTAGVTRDAQGDDDANVSADELHTGAWYYTQDASYLRKLIIESQFPQITLKLSPPPRVLHIPALTHVTHVVPPTRYI